MFIEHLLLAGTPLLALVTADSGDLLLGAMTWGWDEAGSWRKDLFSLGENICFKDMLARDPK